MDFVYPAPAHLGCSPNSFFLSLPKYCCRNQRLWTSELTWIVVNQNDDAPRYCIVTIGGNALQLMIILKKGGVYYSFVLSEQYVYLQNKTILNWYLQLI